MNNLKFRYIYQHKEDLEIADTKDSIWSIEQIAEGEPDNYIDICLSSSWKVIDINQYTGLKDKNGKDIFEGDIIQRQRKDGTFFAKKYIVPNISNIIYQFPTDKILFDLSEHKTIFYDIKNKVVVGNIYENPELFTS